MDPKARRFLWNRIKEVVRDNRSVILTSHSMEECEALCNRIAIMVNGRFRCIGNIQRLKTRFGEGYMVIVKLSSEAEGTAESTKEAESAAVSTAKSAAGSAAGSAPGSAPESAPGSTVGPAKVSAIEKVCEYIKTHFPGTIVKEQHINMAQFQLPATSKASVGAIFTCLEEGRSIYGIEDYSVAQTSLDQMFVSFAQAQVERKLQLP